MRITTIASIGVAALSTAALAQVASSPVEQKVPVAGSTPLLNDMATSDNGASADTGTASNEAAADDGAPLVNRAMPATPEPNKTRPRQ